MRGGGTPASQELPYIHTAPHFMRLHPNQGNTLLVASLNVNRNIKRHAPRILEYISGNATRQNQSQAKYRIDIIGIQEPGDLSAPDNTLRPHWLNFSTPRDPPQTHSPPTPPIPNRPPPRHRHSYKWIGTKFVGFIISGKIHERVTKTTISPDQRSITLKVKYHNHSLLITNFYGISNPKNRQRESTETNQFLVQQVEHLYQAETYRAPETKTTINLVLGDFNAMHTTTIDKNLPADPTAPQHPTSSLLHDIETTLDLVDTLNLHYQGPRYTFFKPGRTQTQQSTTFRYSTPDHIYIDKSNKEKIRNTGIVRDFSIENNLDHNMIITAIDTTTIFHPLKSTANPQQRIKITQLSKIDWIKYRDRALEYYDTHYKKITPDTTTEELWDIITDLTKTLTAPYRTTTQPTAPRPYIGGPEWKAAKTLRAAYYLHYTIIKHGFNSPEHHLMLQRPHFTPWRQWVTLTQNNHFKKLQTHIRQLKKRISAKHRKRRYHRINWHTATRNDLFNQRNFGAFLKRIMNDENIVCNPRATYQHGDILSFQPTDLKKDVKDLSVHWHKDLSRRPDQFPEILRIAFNKHKPRPPPITVDQLFTPPTWEEFQGLLKKMPKKKQAGPTGVPIEFIQQAPIAIQSLIYKFTVKLLQTRDIPKTLTEFRICWLRKKATEIGIINVPAFKNGKKPALRPICFYEHIFKLADRWLLRQQSVIENERYPPEKEWNKGFLKGQTTRDIVQLRLSAIEDAHHYHKQLYLLDKDLSYAYDKVPFWVLEESWKAENYPQEFITWKKRIYTQTRGRSFLANGLLGDPFHPVAGLGQGKISAPNEYRAYDRCRARVINHYHTDPYIITDPTNTHSLKITYTGYVDDSTIYANTHAGLQHISQKDDEFLKLTGMLVNTGKTKTFYSTLNAPTQPPIKVWDGNLQCMKDVLPTPPTKAIRTLGFLIDTNLSWKAAHRDLSTYINRMLNILHTKRITHQQARWIVNHVILGYASYRLQIPYFPETFLKKLDNRIARLLNHKQHMRGAQYPAHQFLTTHLGWKTRSLWQEYIKQNTTKLQTYLNSHSLNTRATKIRHITLAHTQNRITWDHSSTTYHYTTQILKKN